ncbi:hypothetical protein [Pseudorhodoferax sp. Leaf267]|uniref:hypothetical protein n=1 Tax=Pseudorhodoferax sp. Leaf267 TaxID=1736316 RepID=UPI0006F2996D|nr:hypothetical protein [Pseudorhodoferax sp. Leaf267]KQP13761.1 hypothetical protein ASF43_17900 [Pseudorhodoferax sp. Leaf267]
MLEHIAGQGASLRQIAAQGQPRLITLVSQGDQAHEQPLLWQLCQALQGYGYPPVVLDGTSMESATRPGLVDLMQHMPWAAIGATDDSEWAVMPAAAGLRALGQGSAPPLARLGQLLNGCGVLVLYARAELLIPVLAGSQAQPVLAITPGRRAMLRSYGTLKQFRMQAQLVPTLVALAVAPLRNAEQLARTAGRNLQKCAMTFLGCETDMVTVQSEVESGRRNDDVHRLALRLLEGGAAPFAHAGKGL